MEKITLEKIIEILADRTLEKICVQIKNEEQYKQIMQALHNLSYKWNSGDKIYNPNGKFYFDYNWVKNKDYAWICPERIYRKINYIVSRWSKEYKCYKLIDQQTEDVIYKKGRQFLVKNSKFKDIYMKIVDFKEVYFGSATCNQIKVTHNGTDYRVKENDIIPIPFILEEVRVKKTNDPIDLSILHKFLEINNLSSAVGHKGWEEGASKRRTQCFLEKYEVLEKNLDIIKGYPVFQIKNFFNYIPLEEIEILGKRKTIPEKKEIPPKTKTIEIPVFPIRYYFT